jgi:hypothetical protein
MTHYKISQDDLLAFAKKIYDEGCYGYMDLKESVCEALIREFIDGREIVLPIDTNIMAVPENVVIGYMPHGDSVVSFTTNTASNTAMIPSNLSVGAISVIDVPSSGLTWEPDAPQVRLEEYVRPEQNFQGNESERF